MCDKIRQIKNRFRKIVFVHEAKIGTRFMPKIALYFSERKYERYLRHTIGFLEYCDMDRILISEIKSVN